MDDVLTYRKGYTLKNKDINLFKISLSILHTP